VDRSVDWPPVVSLSVRAANQPREKPNPAEKTNPKKNYCSVTRSRHGGREKLHQRWTSTAASSDVVRPSSIRLAAGSKGAIWGHAIDQRHIVQPRDRIPNQRCTPHQRIGALPLEAGSFDTVEDPFVLVLYQSGFHLPKLGRDIQFAQDPKRCSPPAAQIEPAIIQRLEFADPGRPI
jgi:hypothetical protein